MAKSNHVSVAHYASMCEVSLQAIYQRKKRGEIKFITKRYRGHNIFLIDLFIFPPQKRQKVGRKAFLPEILAS